MNRHSYLLFSDNRTELSNSQSSDGEYLYKSPHGVPLLWFFIFGARNVWDPGDGVKARGGAVGQRNPYETQVDVALARLEYAEDALRTDPYLWPWVSALPTLRRKLLAKPPGAFVRCAAPWIIGLEQQHIDLWRAATAYTENSIFHLSSGKIPEAVHALSQLDTFSPFVPSGTLTDRERVAALPHYAEHPEWHRIALLTLGEPDSQESYLRSIERDCCEALAKMEKLKDRKVAVPTTRHLVIPENNGSKSSGVVGKLVGLFRKS